jgi:hypothetical protein
MALCVERSFKKPIGNQLEDLEITFHSPDRPYENHFASSDRLLVRWITIADGAPGKPQADFGWIMAARSLTWPLDLELSRS